MPRLSPRPSHPGPVLLAMLLMLACSDPGLDGFDPPSQRLYLIELDGEAAGVVEERRGRTAAGAPRMDTSIEIHLPGSGWMLREERLQFGSESPYRLQQRTRFTRTPTGIEHHEVVSGEDLGNPDLDSFHGSRRLATAPEGSRLEQPGMFGTGDTSAMNTTWIVKSQDRNGTHARGERADGAEVALWLDAQGLPERYAIGDGFVLRRVTERPLFGPREPAAPMLLAVADPLGDTDNIDAMTLRVTGPAAALLQVGPGFMPAAAMNPTHDDSTQTLWQTRRLAPDLSAEQQAELDRLVAEVRRRIRYHPGAAPPSLDALLEDGRGDCYEFAALFAALAEAAGYQARVVNGLAWAGDERGGFAPHAWNEVRIDGEWLSIDPTWDRIGADAARLRFPDDPARQLDVQMALKRSSLEVVTVERRSN